VKLSLNSLVLFSDKTLNVSMVQFKTTIKFKGNIREYKMLDFNTIFCLPFPKTVFYGFKIPFSTKLKVENCKIQTSWEMFGD
jgi:hypothetical protein